MSENILRIAFMGTPDFAVPALKALTDAGHELGAVYSQPPRPKGRGHKVQLSPVHAYAEEQGIPVFTPTSLKTQEAQEQWRALDLDVAIVAAYGLILPQAVLDAPKYGCLNIHASLLPRWRGAAPIQYAIWKGDTETGITIMQMELGLDTGPMIAKESIAITTKTSAPVLHDALSDMGANMIVDVVKALAQDGAIEAQPQNDAMSTYASMLKKEDGIIDWSCSATEIDQQVRALNPWPGVWATINDKRLKVLEAKCSDMQSDQTPTAVLDKQGHIVCGHKSVLQLIKVQPEGKKAMDVASALNGGYLKKDN